MGDMRAMSCPPSGSSSSDGGWSGWAKPPSSGAGPLPPGVNMKKAKVKRNKNDWSWEDEMLMYDVTQRDTAKKKRRLEKEESPDESKKLKKQKEKNSLKKKKKKKKKKK